jgi:hypothetical protein
MLLTTQNDHLYQIYTQKSVLEYPLFTVCKQSSSLLDSQEIRNFGPTAFVADLESKAPYMQPLMSDVAVDDLEHQDDEVEEFVFENDQQEDLIDGE